MKRLLVITGAAALLGCSGGETVQPDLGPSTFEITILSVNGEKPPTEASPLSAQVGLPPNEWGFKIQAVSPTGEPTKDFNGFVRLTVQPGAVDSIDAPGASGRNALLTNGTVTGTVTVEAVYGPARLWADDIGYTPAPAGKVPACSDGKDNNGNGLVDFPADPGCAYPDDDDENGGTFSAGVSAPIAYDLPKISDVRGAPEGVATPYRNDGVEVKVGSPEQVVVTRVSANGFFVTDVNPTEMTNGNNSVFAFYFSTPPGMRVCDVLTQFSGTTNDFYGFTEVNFPSWELVPYQKGKGQNSTCVVPEPALLGPCASPMTCMVQVGDTPSLQKYESSLVRVQGFTIAKHFGPLPAKNNAFKPGQSNCDFNGDGIIEFTDPLEGPCATACDMDPNCSEWSSYTQRNEYKISNGAAMILIDTSTVAGFDPTANAGQVLESVTGTLTKFSGGSLNWTIETRCPDDLVCTYPGCVAAPVSSQAACVELRTVFDNDEGSD